MADDNDALASSMPDLVECDCCGKLAVLTRCEAFGIETFACDECRDATDFPYRDHMLGLQRKLDEAFQEYYAATQRLGRDTAQSMGL